MKYIDPDGRKIVESDGKPVTYSVEKGWSENTSADVELEIPYWKQKLVQKD